MKVLSLWIVFMCSSPGVSLGQPEDPASDVSGATPIVHQGKPGVWLPMDSARRALAELKQAAAVRDALESTQARLTLEQERTKLLQAEVKSADEIARTWEDVARKQTETIRKLGGKRKWYESPYFWFSVGVLAGGAAATGIVIAVERNR